MYSPPDTSLRHELFYIRRTEREPKVPTDAGDNNFGEVALLE